MKVKVGDVCIFCNRSMSTQSTPNLVFDLEKEELRGLGHATCTNKAKLDWYASKRTGWGEDYPSKEQTRFRCKIAKAMRKLRDVGTKSDQFHVRILLYDCWSKAHSLDDCLSSERVEALLDWWVKGGKQMSQERADRIKKLLRTTLEEALQ